MERYYVEYDEVEKVWDIYRDSGKFYPYYISSFDNPEVARFVRDALESFPKELEYDGSITAVKTEYL